MTARNLLGGGLKQNFAAMFQGIHAQFFSVFCTDWKVWPVYLSFAFSVVPPKMRATTTAFMNASWGVYLSLMTARAAGL